MSAMSGEEEGKRDRGTEGEPLTRTLASDALIGDEEQNGKLKNEKKERNKELASSPATQDHLVTSYDPHGSYGGSILKSPHSKGYIYISDYISFSKAVKRQRFPILKTHDTS